jgi:hypothetical protein
MTVPAPLNQSSDDTRRTDRFAIRSMGVMAAPPPEKVGNGRGERIACDTSRCGHGGTNAA